MGTYQKEKDILEIYKQRRYNELLNEKNAKIDETKKKDPIESFKNKVLKEYVKIYNANRGDFIELKEEEAFINFESSLTPKTIDEIYKIETEFQDKLDDRDRLIQEVKAQIEICENREQEIAIYKMYGILDESGKIYDYKK